MKRLIIHKYTSKFLNDHLCPEYDARMSNCCSKFWKKVTCKYCLRLRKRK